MIRRLLPLTILTILMFQGCMMMSPVHYSRTMDYDASQPPRDLVCGQVIDDEQAFVHDYHGTTYFFESRECLDRFRADPERYISAWEVEQHDHYSPAIIYWTVGVVVMTGMMVLMML